MQVKWKPPQQQRKKLISSLFTGIVQGKGHVRQVQKQHEFSSLHIQFPTGRTDAIQTGASVAINGTCLTVTSQDHDTLTFDIIKETLRATNLGQLQQGSEVNFERSARMGDEIGGHHVSGHVHTTAQVRQIEETENNRRLTFQVPKEWMKYILPKGFIAVDGCSLTVGETGEDWFSIYLIPETLRVTVLGTKQQGDTVNLEIDAQTQAIVDTVEKVVQQYLQQKDLA
ncbi:hypothetical protein ABBQ38_015087 [Trebouxia sp. C0009 RCD-2024]